MSILITLLKNDIKLFFKDWKALLLLLVLPFFFIGLFVYALSPYLNKSNFVEPFSIALVDNEATTQTRIIARQLDEYKIFKEVARMDEAKAKELIVQNKIAAAIIIPAGFSDSILSGENKPVTVIGNKAMPLQAFIAKSFVTSAANLISAAQSGMNTVDHYAREAGLTGEEFSKESNDSVRVIFLEALARNEIFSSIEALQVYDVTPMEYFTAALLIIFLMFSGMPGMKMLVTERSSGITRRLQTAPVRTWQIILSKFIVSTILSIMQFIVIIALTSRVFKNYWGAPVKSILLLFAGIIFAISAWSVFVSAVSRTPAAADVIGNLGILLMAVVGGSIYPLTSMPDFIRKLSDFTINRWAMEGFMVLFSGNDALSVMRFVYALAAIGLVLLALSVTTMKLSRR